MTPSDPKRLVLVCDLAKTYLRFRRPLFLAILEEGYEVHVVFTVASRDELSLVESDGMRGHVIPMDRAKIRPFGDLVYLMRLRYLLRKLQPSVLFSYQIKVAALSCLAARSIAGCRRFVLFPGLGFLVEQGSGPGRPGPLRALANVVFERAFRGVDGVLLQNSDDFDSLVELGIVSGTIRHTVVNGSGVPLEKFDAEPATEEPARFLMAGRLLATKGFREFVEAAKRLRAARGASVEFHIAGGLDEHPSAIPREELDGWIADGNIDYHGEVADIRTLMRSAWVLVLPSFYGEGTPRIILEAMAMSRPVITADSRGCREAVVDGVTGRVVPPRDVDSLAAAMEEYLVDKDLVVQHGTAGRTVAEERYDVNKVVRCMIDFLELS